MKLNPTERKAVEDSIHHWICDIWYPLRKGRKAVPFATTWLWDESYQDRVAIPHGAIDCPLCQLVKLVSSHCQYCPYVVAHLVTCDADENQPWSIFVNIPTAKNAIRMIKKLQGILEADRAGAL
jgi:hypothetical protein